MAGYMTQNGIVVRQGDSFDILLQFRNADGKAINIQDWQIKMSVYDADRKVLKFSKNGDIFDVKEGKARIELKPADTGIDAGDYVTDIQVTTDQNDVHTIFPQDVNRVGVFRITEQVTR